MNLRKLAINCFFAVAAIGLAVILGRQVYEQWQAGRGASSSASEPAKPVAQQDGTTPVRVSLEARKNMGLVTEAIRPRDYFRTIEVPGVITDRPGVSDRGVAAPVTGIVTQIHAYPGNTVPPNAPLVTLRLVSETLHASQLEFFKATKEVAIAQQQKQRLEGLAVSGGVPGARIIEVDNQIQRMGVNVQAYRQDLLARGLSPDRIEAVARGEFVTEITVRAPGSSEPAADESGSWSYEVQSLKVGLGQQVAAGEILCNLADHRRLLVEGVGFKKDMALIRRAAIDRFPIEISFEVSDRGDWPPLSQALSIEHVANIVDVDRRTFSFYIPLENQCQTYVRDGKPRFLWRFRPGDRVRLFIPVEEMKDVFVLPQAAVVREGPDAFVFRQNGDLFDRIPVHVLHEDTTSIVIANDGRLRKRFFIAQNAAATLNRVLKAQLASGLPTNLHVHADGTTHEAH
jgi:hypothetical protein